VVFVFFALTREEYISAAFCEFLVSEGTLSQLSCPGAHAQNSVADRHIARCPATRGDLKMS
jgi:hypothetical protein